MHWAYLLYYVLSVYVTLEVLILMQWLLNSFTRFDDTEAIIAPFAASSGLVFYAPTAPGSQPRCVILGHMIAATIGVSVRIVLKAILGEFNTGAVAVATTALVLESARLSHPPALATSLLSVTGSSSVVGLGFMFVVTPCTVSPIIVVLLATVLNNITRDRHYPQYWLW